jgi:hypothetical protein
MRISGRHLLLQIAEPAKQISPHHWNFPRRTPVRYLPTVSNLLHVYDYVTKLCRQQAEVTQNHENEHVRSTGQGEADTENIRGLNFAAVNLTTV